MNERERIRYRLRVNNLTLAWLVVMLGKRGFITSSASMSAMMSGTRRGETVDATLAESSDILDRYEVYARGEEP